MTPQKFRKLLRQKPPKKDGTPGRFSIRFWYTGAANLRASRVEIGLGTNDEAEAMKTAAIVINTIYALSRFYGGGLCYKVFVEDAQDEKKGIPLPDAFLNKYEKKAPAESTPELPFAPSDESCNN